MKKTMVYYYTVGGGNMPTKVATCQEEDSKREYADINNVGFNFVYQKLALENVVGHLTRLIILAVIFVSACPLDKDIKYPPINL